MPSDELKPNNRELPLLAALRVAELHQLMRPSSVRGGQRNHLIVVESEA